MRKKKVQAAWQLYAFLGFIFGMNAILFITRAYYFRGMLMLDPEITNVFYMLSRACGESKKEKVGSPYFDADLVFSTLYIKSPMSFYGS